MKILKLILALSATIWISACGLTLDGGIGGTGAQFTASKQIADQGKR